MKLTRRDGAVAAVTALVLVALAAAFLIGRTSGHAAAAPRPARSPVAVTSPVHYPKPTQKPSHRPAPAPTPTPTPSAPTPSPSSSAPYTGDPVAGTGTGPACTSIAGYFPGGLPGHEDERPGDQGFCIPDNLNTTTVYDCNQNAVTAPSEIVLACADGNAGIRDITWTNWDTSQAVGYGTAYANTCTPDCAEGTFQTTPVTVTLTDQSHGSPPWFQHMTISGGSGYAAHLDRQYALVRTADSQGWMWS